MDCVSGPLEQSVSRTQGEPGERVSSIKEITGDIWDYHAQGHWIVITTNGSVNRYGEAVMGRGVALQAKQKFPLLPAKLGKALREADNIPHMFHEYRILTLPVKRYWYEKASLLLIETSVKYFIQSVNNAFLPNVAIYMVRPGCGNGQLDWAEVKPILEKYLDDRFIVVERGK